MAITYAYAYAEVQDSDGLCIGVMSSSNPNLAGPTGMDTTYISIPDDDDGYFLKYYLNGAWYEDAEGTIPWSPA